MEDIERAIRDAIELQRILMDRIKELSDQLLECRCDTHRLTLQNSLLQTAIGFNMSAQTEIERLQALTREQREIIDRLQAGKEQNSPPN